MQTVLDRVRPSGGRHLAQAIGALLIAAVLLGQSLTARADHETQAGLYTETHYIGVQFLYELQWDAPWEADEVFIASEVGEYDRLYVYGLDAKVSVVHNFGDDLDEEMETATELISGGNPGFEVVERGEGVDELGLPYVSATIAFDSNDPDDFEGELIPWIGYIEVGVAYTNDLDEGIRVLSLEAPAEALSEVYREVQATFVPNQGMTGPFFAGQPASDGDGERNRTSHGGRGAPDDRNDEETNVAEAEYLAELERQFEYLTDSVDRFFALVNDPDFGDQASIAEAEEILSVWTVAPFAAYMLTPPPGYEEVNAAFVRLTELLYATAEAIFDGDETAAVANLEQAQEYLEIVAELLNDAAGVDLLDRPSGWAKAWASTTRPSAA